MDITKKWDPDEEGGYELILNEDLSLRVCPLSSLEGVSWHVEWPARTSESGVACTVEEAKKEAERALLLELRLYCDLLASS